LKNWRSDFVSIPVFENFEKSQLFFWLTKKIFLQNLGKNYSKTKMSNFFTAVRIFGTNMIRIKGYMRSRETGKNFVGKKFYWDWEQKDFFILSFVDENSDIQEGSCRYEKNSVGEFRQDDIYFFLGKSKSDQRDF